MSSPDTFGWKAGSTTDSHFFFPHDCGLVFMKIILQRQSFLAELLGIFVKSVTSVFFSVCPSEVFLKRRTGLTHKFWLILLVFLLCLPWCGRQGCLSSSNLYDRFSWVSVYIIYKISFIATIHDLPVLPKPHVAQKHFHHRSSSWSTVFPHHSHLSPPRNPCPLVLPDPDLTGRYGSNGIISGFGPCIDACGSYVNLPRQPRSSRRELF